MESGYSTVRHIHANFSAIADRCDNAKLHIICEQFPGITHIDLTNCKEISDFAPLSRLENLKTIILDNTNITNLDFLKGDKAKLETLSIRNCASITNDQIQLMQSRGIKVQL